MKSRKVLLRVSGALLPFVFGCVAWSQTQPAPDPLNSTIQMLQEFAAHNAAQLRSYQWIETTTTTVDGQREIKEEMAQVHEVTAVYLPLNPDNLEAVRTRQVGFEREPTSGAAVVLSNYAKQGDQLTFALDSTARQIQSISVKTFLSSQDDPLYITVQFSRLEDGTVYPSITNIQAPSEQISITTLSSDFSKPVQ